MPNRPGNDDRIGATGGDGGRGGQRDVSSDNARENGSGSQQNNSAQARTRSNRGFASMDRTKQREIASKGGRAAHAKGTAHEFDSGEAREAGRKGGVAVSRSTWRRLDGAAEKRAVTRAAARPHRPTPPVLAMRRKAVSRTLAVARTRIVRSPSTVSAKA
jgi:uncharacterized protein